MEVGEDGGDGDGDGWTDDVGWDGAPSSATTKERSIAGSGATRGGEDVQRNKLQGSTASAQYNPPAPRQREEKRGEEEEEEEEQEKAYEFGDITKGALKWLSS